MTSGVNPEPTRKPAAQIPARSWKIIAAGFLLSGVALLLAFGFLKNPILLALGAAELIASVVLFMIANSRARQ